MSVTIKFTITDQQYEDLCLKAADAHPKLSIQDYIRKELFEEAKNITPQQAVDIALSRYSKGSTFTLEDLFPNGLGLPKGVAGQFGQLFSRLVKSEYSQQVVSIGTLNGRQTVYKVIKS